MRICIYVYISLCIWISLFFFVTRGTRGIRGVNNIISPRRVAPVARDHYNFITSSHSNIDDDGDGDDVSGEFSYVILAAAWARSPFRCDLIGSSPDASLEHWDVFRHHLHMRTTRCGLVDDRSRILETAVSERFTVVTRKRPRASHVEISRSRVGTLGRGFPTSFRRLERF